MQFFNVSTQRRPQVWIALIAIFILTFVGAWVRLYNASPYLLYSDSYQSLVVAEHIQAGDGLIAPLGEHGMEYPRFVGWTRPMFSVLINIVSSVFSLQPVVAAQAISLFAGIAAIPLAIVAIGLLLRSIAAGIAAGLVMAISFNAVVWSGFALTDTTAVLLQLIMLLLLVMVTRTRPYYGNPADIALGVILLAAILTRYEYAALLLPALYIIGQFRDNWRSTYTNIGFGFAFAAGIMYAICAPLGVSSTELLAEAAKPFFAVISVALVATAAYSVRSLVPRLLVTNGLVIGCGILLMYASGLRDFIRHELLLLGAAAIGSASALKQSMPVVRNAYLLTFAALAGSYLATNASLERYWIHLMPLLLILAGYSVRYINRAAASCITIVLITLQVAISVPGMQHWSGGVWHQRGYEQAAATALAPHIQKSDVVIAAMPEPYYLATHASVQSVSQNPPYLPLSDIPDTSTIVIVNDGGMEAYFPSFYQFVNEKLVAARIHREFIDQPLRIVRSVDATPPPTTLYRLTKQQYVDLIEKNTTVQNGRDR
jgi:hypothetical protein